MAIKLNKIRAALGLHSKARKRKMDAVDVAKQAHTKIPRFIMHSLGLHEAPIIGSLFEHWEGNRNKLAESRIRKNQLHKQRADRNERQSSRSTGASVRKMAAEDIKDREEKRSEEATHKANQYVSKAAASAAADQGSSQVKLLTSVEDELKEIKGVLKNSNKHLQHLSGKDGGGLLGSIEKKLKGGLGKTVEKFGAKFGAKKLLGRLAKFGGKKVAEDAGATAAEDAGGAVAGDVAGGAAVAGGGALAAGGAAAGGGALAGATALALPALAVAAAAAGGTLIGHEIHKHILAGTKIDDMIGSGISHVLGFFGDKTAQDANKASSMAVKPTKFLKKRPAFEKAISALNPIGVAHADEIPANQAVLPKASKVSRTFSLNPVPKALIPGTKKSTNPLEQLVSYMSALFDLSSDPQKGVYVRKSENVFTSVTPTQSAAPVAPTVRATQSPGAAKTDKSSMPGPGRVSTSLGSSPFAQTESAPVGASRSSSSGSMGSSSASGRGSISSIIAGSRTGGNIPGSMTTKQKSYGTVNGFNIDMMWNKMKNSIAGSESGAAGYDAHHGGTIRGLTRMSIGQLKHMKGAMGKYQLMPEDTLGEAEKAVGLTDRDLFSPANQDAMGKWLFAQRVKRGSKHGVAGIQKQLAEEWASLPENTSGKGYYDHDSAGNMASGGSKRGQMIASIISGSKSSGGSMSGSGSDISSSIDSASNEVASASTPAPSIIAIGGGGGASSSARAPIAGTGAGVSGPMTTRNPASAVQALTRNFQAGSSAMG